MAQVRVAALGVAAMLVVVLVPRPASADSDWSASTVRISGGIVSVAGLGRYRGTVELRAGPGGVTVIDEVPFEQYVAGVSEMPPEWPSAALQAQAIAARTYGLWTLLRQRAADPARARPDICATESCQRYRGVDSETGNWPAAVAATAGRVLLDRGRVIPAFYASSNGGLSMGLGVPYLPEVRDPDDLAVSPWSSWRSSVSVADIDRLYPGDGPLTAVHAAEDVELVRSPTDGGTTEQHLAREAFRAALNASVAPPPGVPVAVPSVRFSAELVGDHVDLVGGGYGHLTGMSQYGALGKALRGMPPDDILAAYFGGLRPSVLQPSQLPAIRVGLRDAAPSVGISTVATTQLHRDADAPAPLPAGTWTVRARSGRLIVSGPEPVRGQTAMTLPPSAPVIPAAAPTPVHAAQRTSRPPRTLPTGVAVAAVALSATALVPQLRRRVRAAPRIRRRARPRDA